MSKTLGQTHKSVQVLDMVWYPQSWSYSHEFPPGCWELNPGLPEKQPVSALNCRANSEAFLPIPTLFWGDRASLWPGTHQAGLAVWPTHPRGPPICFSSTEITNITSPFVLVLGFEITLRSPCL